MLSNILERIPGKYKKADFYIMNVKHLIYIAVFAWFCYLDHIIGSAEGYMQEGLKIYTGVLLAVIILMNYKLKDYWKIPYGIWLVVYAVIFYGMMKRYYHNCYNDVELISGLVGIGVYGILLIRLFYLYVMERKKPQMHWKPFIVCAVMLIAMAVIRTDYASNRDLCIAMILFYLTDFKEKDLNNLYSGMVEGIILGFLLCQGYAWLHRPYMNDVRYLGMYCHPGMNALFYLVVYSAILCKWYQMKLKKRRWYFRLPLILLAGLILALTLYTGSRTALICIMLVTFLFLLFQVLSKRKCRLKEVLIDGVALVMSMVLCIIPTFVLIRYVPEKVNDYVFFAYDEEYKGLISFEVVNKVLFDRIFWFSEDVSENVQEFVGDLFDMMFPASNVGAMSWEEEYFNPLDEVYVNPGTDSNHPLLTTEEENDPVKIRLSIYEYFLGKLELIGEKNNVQGVWLTRDYYAYHTHNYLLQVAYDYGILICAALIAVIMMIYNRVIVGLVERKSGSWYFRLFCTVVFVTAFLAFGMLEITWTYGQIGFTLFWLMQYTVYHKEEWEQDALEE